MSDGHGHSHAGGAAGNRRRLAIVLALTASVLVVEVVGALVSGSLALLADAAHAFVDSAGLGALVAAIRQFRSRDRRVRIVGIRPNVFRLLCIAGLDRIVFLQSAVGVTRGTLLPDAASTEYR